MNTNSPKKLKKDRPIEKDIILRELYRNFGKFQACVEGGGSQVIEYAGLSFSFWDMQKHINKLSPRKRQAFYLNVIEDLLQKDVAAIMGVTMVTVGQYVKQSCIQLSEMYFGEEEVDEEVLKLGKYGKNNYVRIY